MSRRARPDRERGATLMFALAILALLVLFSTVFARLMSIERRASAYYRDRVRAKLAARAGIERAIVELRAVAGQNHFSDPYGGGWKYHKKRPTDYPLGRAVDLLSTTYPSFRQEHGDKNGDGQPDFMLWGEPLTYSGYLGQPDEQSILFYRLKILDGGSQLNLNHPDQRSANRMLKNLLFSTFQDSNDRSPPDEDDTPPGNPDFDLTEAQATQIANIVIPLTSGTGPGVEEVRDRFRSKPQLGSAIIDAAESIGIDRRDMEDGWQAHLRDKVTVYSWNDPDVIRPFRLNVPDGANPRKNLPLLPRAPVNLNTASIPVLYALFAELKAETRYGTFEITKPVAEALANAIVARRNDLAPGASGTGFNPFKSWPEFENWLDDSAQDGIFASLPAGLGAKLAWPGNMDWAPTGGLISELHSSARVGARDLIKAQLNPNTMLNKFGSLPTHGGYKRRYSRLVDKSDIVRMTTEGCFDSLGVFEITSTGVIMNKDLRNAERGALISAGHTDLAVVRVYTPFRLTTQSQFEKHRANNVRGNFIESPEKKEPAQYDTNDAFMASVNKPAFFRTVGDTLYDSSKWPLNTDTTTASVPVDVNDPKHLAPGWPGMVSWPQYSLKRVDTRSSSLTINEQSLQYPVADSANPATWDGHLTLSNMITVRTGDNDFVAGFSRGSLEAFKVRAWWEPKDLTPSGGKRIAAPTRPADAAELAYLANSLTRGDQAPRLTDATGLESVVAEDFSDTPPSSDLDAISMFTEGSALVNTGVVVGPDRGNRFLAYDSNNIDLNQGTSIRFWVQPLIDPCSREEEILFYFSGSNGSKPDNQQADPDYSGWSIPTRTGTGNESTPRHGVERQAGFAVVKEYDSTTRKVTIRLRDLADDFGSADHYRWLASGPDLSIDVTPSILTGAGELSKPDPANPEWIPGSWHWIVINIGPGMSSSAVQRREAFASIQVDKKKVGGTNTPSGIVGRFRGEGLAEGQGGTAELGEVHAYREQFPSASINNFASAVHAGNSNDSATVWRIFPRMLGDFYQCTQYDSLSSGSAITQNGAQSYGAGTATYRREWLVGDPSKGEGEAMKYKQESGGNFPVGVPPEARWTGGSTAGKIGGSGDDGNFMWYDFVNSQPSPGWYFPHLTWPGPPMENISNPGSPPYPGNWLPFPVLCDNRSQQLEFFPKPGSPSAVPGPQVMSFTNGGWDPNFPGSKRAPPSPFGWENGDDYPSTTPNGPSGNAAQRWPYPGGPKEWHIGIRVSWDEIHYTGRSPWAGEPWAGPGGSGFPSGGWLPADLSQLDMINHPYIMHNHPRITHIDPDSGYESRGGRLPYAAMSSAQQNKNNARTTQANSPTTPRLLYVDNGSTYTSFIRDRNAMRFKLQGSGGSGALVPKDAIDDDCHGCEDCDLDGPACFGAAPGYGQDNYLAGGALGAPDTDTMAVAVFDNIVFVNQDPDRRTDFPNISGSADLYAGDTVILAAKDFEDRFFEDNLAEFLRKRATTEGESVDSAKGTGAVFHRGLVELRNRQFRLASMTWTSYPTRVTNLDFELGLWKIDNVTLAGGRPTYNYANDELLDDTARDNPHLGFYDPSVPAGPSNNGFAQDPAEGGRFGHKDFGQRKLDFLTNFFQPDITLSPTDLQYVKRSPFVDGLGNPTLGVPSQVLVLGVRLQGHKNDHLASSPAADPTSGVEADSSQGVLVSPVLETPIFEDVTLNLTFPRPQYLYVEEGAIE